MISQSNVEEFLRRLLSTRALPKNAIRATIVPEQNMVVLFVANQRVSTQASRGNVSERQIANIRSALEKQFGTAIRVAYFASTEFESVLKLVRNTIAQSLGIISTSDDSMLIPVGDNRYKVRIGTERPSEDALSNLASLIRPLLMNINGELSEIEFTYHPRELPISAPSVLRLAQIHAPVTLAALDRVIRTTHSVDFDVRDLRRTLDRLRKARAIAYLSGSYVLTDSGLSALPKQRGRNAGDVQRALVLGRRRW